MTTAGLMTGRLRKARVPHPLMPLLVRRTIEDAIRLAWEQLRKNSLPKSVSLKTAKEVHINAQLVKLLNKLLDTPDPGLPSFSASMFQIVTRGGELESYNGKHLEKRPDMVFRLIQARPGISSGEYDGLFAECKILDDKHPLSLYCQNGLKRFIRGEYAWAMQEALMIAYTRKQWSLRGKLGSYLKRRRKSYGTDAKLKPRPSEAPAVPQVLLTHHSRNWTYDSGGAPGKIEIAHLWLDAMNALPKGSRVRHKQRRLHRPRSAK